MGKLHWLALSTVSGIGGATATRLVERFGSIEDAFSASEEELAQVPRITPAMAHQLRSVSLEVLEEELMSLSDEGIAVFTWDDEDYPANLREAPDSPPVIFVRGALLPQDACAVALVGTREPSESGAETAWSLGRELASRGVTVVSGLALGIDTAAHRGALDAADGRTVAVLGCGVRSVHPRSNAPLAREIVERGALLSELHPSSPVRGPHLMARDRIISGLSRALVVVEAGAQSGSLDTAAKARRQGRLVYAVPGSEGTDALLSQGAHPLGPTDAQIDELLAVARTAPPSGRAIQPAFF